MKLNELIKEIKNKDLTKLTENELHEYKTYLEDTNINAEKVSKVNTYKKTLNIVSLIISLVAGGLSIYMLYLLISNAFIQYANRILILVFVDTVLMGLISILKRVSKKVENNYQELKLVCKSKLMEVDNCIKAFNSEKEAKNNSEVDNA